MTLEYAVFLLLGIVVGLAAYAAAAVLWYANFWWQNNPGWPFA